MYCMDTFKGVLAGGLELAEVTGYRRLKPASELKIPGPHRAVKNVRYFEDGKEIS